MEEDLDEILNESAKEFDKKLTLNEEKKVTSSEETPKVEPGFKSLLEDVNKNLDFEKMGFNKDEFEKANELFANMMKDMGEPETAAGANPFLQEYMQDRQQDQQKTGIPDNIGDILNDKEF